MFMPSGVAAAAGTGVIGGPMTMVAGDPGSGLIGYEAGTAGTLDPKKIITGFEIEELWFNDNAPSGFDIFIPGCPDDDTTGWSYVTMSGVFAHGSDTLMLRRDEADAHSSSTWIFKYDDNFGFVLGNTYTIEFFNTTPPNRSVYQLTAAASGNYRGWSTGYSVVPAAGSILPNASFNGRTLTGIMTTTLSDLYIAMDGASVPNTNATWTEIIIRGDLTGPDWKVTENRSTLAYSSNVGSDTQWGDSGILEEIMQAGLTYRVEIYWT